MTKIIFNKQLLAMICLFMAIGIISSCKKDLADNSGKVQLLSFGPTGAKHGDTLRFFGSNLDKVTEIQLTGATVPSPGFISKTAELILIIVPASTKEGFVTLKTPDGDIVSKTRINFLVPVTIASMTAKARPGENITIKGQFMNWVREVRFAKNLAETTFVSQSLTELVVKVPATAQTGTLFLSSGGTEPLEIETLTALQVALPLITNIAPVPVLHAANLTITGTDLDLTTGLLFTGQSTPITTFVSKSATQIVVKVPAQASKGKITLTAPSGLQTVSSVDADVVLPTIATMAPNPIDPGANITITGMNLDLVTSVTFPNAPAVSSFVSNTATSIVVKVPIGVLRGKVILNVLNSTLTVLSSDILEINGSVPPPTISFPIYKDAITANWNGWIGGGWGGTSNRSNTTPVREGSNSIKIDYVGGYGSPLQLGGANLTLSGFTTFKVSIYGGPGTTGKRVNIGINGSDSYNINLVEGKWTDYSIPISTLTSATSITALIIKEYSGTGGFTIYVDALGLN